MPTILSRSNWTSTSARGSAITWSRVRGIVCHYPAMGASVGVLTKAQEAARLRGWRSYHVNSLGWKDIGYSYGIGQSGRIYSLRGDRVGGHTYGHNATTLGVLFIVGDNEPLTAAAKASFRALRATLRKRGASSGVWGHTEMSGNSTRCPGPYIMGDIRSGALKAGSGGTTAPSTPAPSKPPATGGTSPHATGSPGKAWTTSPRVNAFTQAEIRSIQHVLLGFDLDLGRWGADGKYGDTTGKAVQQLQKELHITPTDGIYGPGTEKAVMTIREDISKIKRALEPGVTGKRTDGEFAAFIRSQRDVIRGDTAKIIRTLEPGVAGTRTDGEAILALRKFRNDVRADIAAARGEQAALEKALQAVAGAQGVDLDEVRAAAREGVASALRDLEADVTLTLTTEEG